MNEPSRFTTEDQLKIVVQALDCPGQVPEYELNDMLFTISEAIERGEDVSALVGYREFERRLRLHAAQIMAQGDAAMRAWDHYCFEPGRAIFKDRNKHWWYWLMQPSDGSA